MKIADIQTRLINLPFRFSFGHSLASRKESANVIVRVELRTSTGKRVLGWGESIPRDYVTGESAPGALKRIREEFIPLVKELDLSTPLDSVLSLSVLFHKLELDRLPYGASWCAFELAILDAVAKANGLSFASLLSAYDVVRRAGGGAGSAKQVVSTSIAGTVTYGAVAPFGKLAPYLAMLLFFKSWGFRTLKLKVGRDWQSDIQRLELARRILGNDIILRVDANCAWTVDETMYMAERMRPFKITSIEQPLEPDDYAGMQRLTKDLPEAIIADESLCTLEQARALIDLRACDGFNIRLSKVGGPLVAMEIVDLARTAGVDCMLGAQVGESAILTAAGRAWAAVKGPFSNAEGSFNKYLLARDVSVEDMSLGRGGLANVPTGPGLGITVLEKTIKQLSFRENRENRNKDNEKSTSEDTVTIPVAGTGGRDSQ